MECAKKLTRRAFLQASALAFASALAGCAPPTAEVVRETVVVKETVPVKETVVIKEGSIPVGQGAWAYDPNRPVNDGKPITIKLWSGLDTWRNWFDKWIPAYRTIHPNVKFDHTFTPWAEHIKKVAMAIPSGQGPDIYSFHNTFTTSFVEGGLIEPYPDEWIPLLRQDYDNIDARLVKGKLYYFDLGLMIAAMWYNKKYWAEAGLKEGEYPKTWAEFTEVAKRLTTKDASGRITRVGLALKGYQWDIWQQASYQTGHWFLSPDGKHAYIDTEEGRKCFQMIDDWYHKDQITSPEFPPPREAFGTGQAAMMHAWGWVKGVLDSQYPDIEWGVFRLPTWTGDLKPCVGIHNGDCSPGVNPKSSTEAKAVAFDFLHWLLSNEDAAVEACLFTQQGAVMKRIKDRPELLQNPMINVTLQVLDRTLWVGNVPQRMDELMAKYINDAIENGVPMAQALPALQKELDADIARQPSEYWTVERLYKYAADMHD